MEEIFFERAWELAEKGRGFTSPNPCVGAVVVKNGKVIGEGYHKKAGEKHAEVIAIQHAQKRGFSVQGADIYVTLEPCCHVGKTPACTDLLIRSGIKRVFVGMKDPFDLVKGKGIRILKKNGMDVFLLSKNHLLSKKIRLLNQPFLKWALTGFPYVTLKCAVSLDGKIATSAYDSKWITGNSARKDSRTERSMCDAVLVGSGTVKKDNPELAPHGPYAKKNLKRIIFDPDLSSPLSSQVFRDSNVLVLTTSRASKQKIKIFLKKGISVKIFSKEKIIIKDALEYLGKNGMQHIFVEGGSRVHGSFFDASLKDFCIDHVIWYIAPKLMGGTNSINSVAGRGVKIVKDAHILKSVQVQTIGDDIKVSGYLNLY